MDGCWSEVSHLVAGYETVSGVKDEKNESRHHEQKMTAQKIIQKKVKSSPCVVKEMGNSFQEESADLLVLDTKNVADPPPQQCLLHFTSSEKISLCLSWRGWRKKPGVHSINK